MTERLSTGMRNWILAGASVREGLDDFVRKIYSGTPPAEADDAVSGTLLVTITKASGAVLSTDRSVPSRWKLVLAAGHTENNTVKISVTVDGAATTYTYTITAADTTDELVAEHVARMLTDIPQVFAICVGTGIAARTIVAQGRIRGLALTLADASGDIAVTPTQIEAASRGNTLYYAYPSAGSASKSTDTWSGLVATSGVAGYFRDVRPNDDGTESTTQRRLQGTVSTSGAELNMANTSLVAATTHTIDTYAITQPAEE